MSLRAATMFSGIGAPEVARPDWDWRWCAEIEKFPAAVHALRHSQGGRGGNQDVPNLGDVSAPDFVERAKGEGAIDVLVFGSPCQSFSVAGKRLGLDDARGNLALVSLAIARQLRPRWLVFENVPGLLSSDAGRDFGIFLRVMEECGYLGAWRILDAQYAGVPQRRRRIFFVGYIGDWRPAAAVLFEPESLRGDSPPRREARKGIATTISARTKGGGGLGSDFEIDGGLIADKWPAEIAPTLNAHFGDKMGLEDQHALNGAGHFVPVAMNLRGREGGAMPEIDDVASVRAASGGSSRSYVAHAIQERAVSENVEAGPQGKGYQEECAFTLEARNKVQSVAHALRSEGFDASEDGTGRGTPLVPVAFSCKDFGADMQRDQTPTLRSMNHSASHANAGGQLAVAFDTTQVTSKANRSNPKAGDPCHPLAAGAHAPALADQYAVRRLTPRECERLQGFPDDFTAIEWRGKPVDQCPDGPRYKALGNSMAVPVMEWILGRIETFENEVGRQAAAA